jgi:hypothetical protein
MSSNQSRRCFAFEIGKGENIINHFLIGIHNNREFHNQDSLKMRR